MYAVEGQTLKVGVVDGSPGSATLSRTIDGRWRLTWLDDWKSVALQSPPPPSIDLLLALPRPKVLTLSPAASLHHSFLEACVQPLYYHIRVIVEPFLSLNYCGFLLNRYTPYKPFLKVMTRLWAPLAQLGVGAVYLTNATRTERYYFDSSLLTRETVRSELIRGLEQAGGTRLPLVFLSKRLPPVVDAAFGRLSWEEARLVCGQWLIGQSSTPPPVNPLPPTVVLVAHPAPGGLGLQSVLESALCASSTAEHSRSEPTRLLIAIGPEG